MECLQAGGGLTSLASIQARDNLYCLVVLLIEVMLQQISLVLILAAKNTCYTFSFTSKKFWRTRDYSFSPSQHGVGEFWRTAYEMKEQYSFSLQRVIPHTITINFVQPYLWEGFLFHVIHGKRQKSQDILENGLLLLELVMAPLYCASQRESLCFFDLKV